MGKCTPSFMGGIAKLDEKGHGHRESWVLRSIILPVAQPLSVCVCVCVFHTTKQFPDTSWVFLILFHLTIVTQKFQLPQVKGSVPWDSFIFLLRRQGGLILKLLNMYVIFILCFTWLVYLFCPYLLIYSFNPLFFVVFVGTEDQDWLGSSRDWEECHCKINNKT